VVPKTYGDLVDEAIGGLISNGKLFEKPGTTKSKKYTTRRPRPTSVLTARQRQSLETIVKGISAHRSHPLTLSELLEFLDGPVSRPPAGTLTLDRLEELYRVDLPSRGGLTSMPIPVTWRHYAAAVQAEGNTPNRAEFERVLLQGRGQGRIEMTTHEWPATLSAEEAAAAISQADGRVLYYWRPLKER
jgi:hypothetical protein